MGEKKDKKTTLYLLYTVYMHVFIPAFYKSIPSQLETKFRRNFPPRVAW